MPPGQTPAQTPGQWRALGLALLLVGVGVGGCQTWKGSELYVKRWQPAWKGQDKEATYRAGLPGAGWDPLQQEGTQVAWQHTTDPAVIQVHSECEDHGDSDLEDFTDHQRIDYTSWEIVEEPTGESMPRAGRACASASTTRPSPSARRCARPCEPTSTAPR
ncbi:MAG: hypothetical protein HC927_09805 [Deltaproteobacteria bacterium]|nr:hypothetical protein [Deltaproteobacteria bacterium]